MPRPPLAALTLAVGALCTVPVSADDREKKAADPLKYAAVTVVKIDPKASQITVKYRVNDKGEEQTKTFKYAADVRLLDETGQTVAIDVFEAGSEALILEAEGKLQEVRRYTHSHRGTRLSDAVVTLVEMAGGEDGSVEEVQRIYDLLRKLDPAGTGKIDPAAVRAESDRIVTERVASLIQRLDADKDGKVSQAEARGVLKDHFAKLDPNRDGRIDRDELLQAAKARRDAAPTAQTGRN